tara:strand:- start:446 stop:745 length:300 start_codon:yes stop_codon:yes gene_type:complete
LKILHENCDRKLADDKELPYTAFLVQYELEGKAAYDIAISSKAVEIFDHYYDKYKKDFKRFDQTGGMVDPRRWSSNQKAAATPPRKTRKRKRKGEDGED